MGKKAADALTNLENIIFKSGHNLNTFQMFWFGKEDKRIWWATLPKYF